MKLHLFSDDQVCMQLLRQRAYNLRWAMLPEDVIALTAADPDFPVAPEIREAVCNYVRDGVLSYGPPEGLSEFRHTTSHIMTSRKGIPCSSKRILAVNGAAAGMFVAAKFALKPGDEALIFDPVDFLFRQSVEEAGGKAVTISLDTDHGSFDPDQVRRLITPRTRMIGICNPHNPLGRVLTREELQFLGDIAVEHKLWILNDEIWSDIIYSPQRHLSIATLSDEIAQRTITVYGFSKTFGLAGLRIGFLISPNLEVHESLVHTSRVRTTAAGTSTVSQIAAIAAFEKAWYWVEAFVAHLTKLRDEGVERLNAIPGVTCHAPEGTYLLFPDIRSFGLSSQQMADYLLKEARVAVVPGASQWFGPGAEGHIRICFSTSRKIFREGLDRIETALRKLL